MSRIFKRLLMTAAGFGLLGFNPSTILAQDFVLDLYAGVALPTGRINDLTSPGFSGGLGLGYILNRTVGIRADFAGEWLNRQEPDVPLPDLDSDLFDRDVNLYHYDASVMLHAIDPRRTNWNLAIFTDASRFGGSTWSSFPIWGGFGVRVN